MRIWYAIIIAPALALADQSVAYAVVGWACANQNGVAVHAVHAMFLVATSAGVVLAWQAWRETLPDDGDEDAHRAQRNFRARVGMAVAGLSAAGVVAMWGAVWVISVCVA
jgi:hypothetical protein